MYIRFSPEIPPLTRLLAPCYLMSNAPHMLRKYLSSVLAPAWLLLGSSHPFGSSTQMILAVVLLLSLGSLISYPPTPSIFMV